MLWSSGEQSPGTFQSPNTHRAARNHHPTVKPVALMRWLVRLVTPPGGLILDPFCGSGTTGVACVLEGRAFLGIEKDAEYVAIARCRIAEAQAQGNLFAGEGA
jgi:DNA modification methylase